jgi:hypothetical protein
MTPDTPLEPRSATLTRDDLPTCVICGGLYRCACRWRLTDTLVFAVYVVAGMVCLANILLLGHWGGLW